MKRNVNMEDISDGRLYEGNDLAKLGCRGCGSCCRGMGRSIVLDPLDAHRIALYLKTGFGELLGSRVEFNVVDGIVLPNLKMDGEGERCGFLSRDHRCQIHPARPGICRMFPLGRYYEEQGFRYFLQIHECRNKMTSKVRIRKWLDTEEPKRYEGYIRQWHDFLMDMEAALEKHPEEAFQRSVSMQILQEFYMKGFESDRDFYEQFEERLQEVRKKIEV